jgi:hypothetical protein
MRWAGHVAHVGEKIGVHMVFVGEPERKRSRRRPRPRLKGNIQKNLQKIRTEVGGGGFILDSSGSV